MMPREVVLAMVSRYENGEPEKLDDRLNRAMVEFMRDMMRAVSDSQAAAMEAYHSPIWDRDAVIDVMLEFTNVEFWSVHAPYGPHFDPSSPIEEMRESAVEGCRDALKVAKRLSARLIVVHPGAARDFDYPRDARLHLAVDTLKQIADLAGEMGVRVAIEPLPKDEIGNSLDEVLWLIERIDRPNMGVNFDVNHLYPAAAIPDLIRKAGSLILNVHVSDQDDRERHWLPFAGRIDWREVLAALSEAGYAGPLIYETHIQNEPTCADICRIVVENYSRLIGLAR